MTDSHCHLDHCENPEAAADPSLSAIVSIGTTAARSRSNLALSEGHANVWVAVGIHPNNASDARREEVRREIADLAQHPRVVAIGESGFDTHWDKETLDTQRENLVWQAELAAELDKALILHVRDKQNRRDASAEAARVLRELAYPKGILHCFSGDAELLETGLELGWLVSFAGNLTYKNAKALHEAAKAIPRERLLVETDSPFLTPVPRRGERNLPANVRFTAQALAELRGESLAEVEAYTDANARRIYGLKAA